MIFIKYADMQYLPLSYHTFRASVLMKEAIVLHRVGKKNACKDKVKEAALELGNYINRVEAL